MKLPLKMAAFIRAQPWQGRGFGEKRYLAYLHSFRRRYLTIVPRIGANAWQIWAAAWLYMKKSRKAGHVHWGVCTWNLEKRIMFMLEQGLPVIFCVGPNMNPFLPKQRVSMYQIENGILREKCKVRAHYMNITGLFWNQEEEMYLQVSSWGRCYYISWAEYLKYRNNQPPLLGSWLSNILYLRVL